MASVRLLQVLNRAELLTARREGVTCTAERNRKGSLRPIWAPPRRVAQIKQREGRDRPFKTKM